MSSLATFFFARSRQTSAKLKIVTGLSARLQPSQKGKKTSESLTCRFCKNDLPETQEHLEICDGTKFERRGVSFSEVMGKVEATVTLIPEVHLPDALGVYT